MRLLARILLRRPYCGVLTSRTMLAAIVLTAMVLVIAPILFVLPAVAGTETGNRPLVNNAPIPMASGSPSRIGRLQSATISHYVYVFLNGQVQIFDMDNGHQLVKTVGLSGINSVLGLAVSTVTGKLYISYGGTGGSQGTGSLAEYDLMTDKIVWQRSYSHGTDSLAVTPDGKTLYVPDGESSGDHALYVVDPATGNELGTITVGTSPHNGMMGLDGKQVYVGPRDENNLYVVNTATNTVIRTVGPLIATNVVSGNGVRPYAINGKQTLAFTTESGFLGFQVSDINKGTVLYTVSPTGFTWNGTGPSAPCHGISLSPDEREIYLIDTVNDVVHVYDVSGVPASAPVLVTTIKMSAAFFTIGWLQHSLDGRFVYVSDTGDVIDTATRTTMNNLPIASALMGSRAYIEVDWSNGVPIAGALSRGGQGYLTGSATSSAPTASLSSSSLTFASQRLNTTSSSQSVSLTNTGNAALNISSIRITGTNSGDFSQTNNCGNSVSANNGSCTIRVTFRPSANGTRTASVTITDNASGSPQSITLRGTGGSGGTPAPAVSLSNSNLIFASQALNSTSGSQSVTLTNVGNATLNITNIGITGANSSNFAQNNNCGNSLAANSGSCNINVTFTPTAAGTRTASVTITDNASGSPQSIALSGSGGGSSGSSTVVLTPTSFNFGSVAVGATGTTTDVNIKYVGSSSLSVNSVTITGDFSLNNFCGNASLSQGFSCDVWVTFMPKASGIRNGTLTFNTNAPDSPHIVTLTGTGGSGGASTPAVSLSSSSLTFASQALNTSSGSQSVTVSNTGSAALSVTNIGVTGANSADFSQTNNCGNSVAANSGSCVISVTFRPSATGARTSTLAITDNASGSPQTVSLTGTGAGASAPVVNVSSSSLIFASRALNTTSGSQSVTLTNTGNSALSISGISLTGANSGDFAQTNNCGNSVAANNGSCTISVTFTPAASGSRSASVTISDNATGSPQSITLAGTGAGSSGASTVVVSPSSFDFGSAAVGSTGTTADVNIMNIGSSTLNITGIAITGDFSLTNFCGNASLSQGFNCDVWVTFTPKVSGIRTGTLIFSTNAPDSPHVVTLTGTGN